MTLTRPLAEAGDDHFYGAWHGGSKAAGGHPGGAPRAAGGTSSPAAAMAALASGKSPNIKGSDVPKVMDLAAGRKDNPDLTRLRVDGKAPWGGGLGYARSEMPQVPTAKRGPWLDSLRARGISVTTDSMSPRDLKPMQSEVSITRSAELLGLLRSDTYDPSRLMVVSKDNYILDGHHRWGASIARTYEDPSFRVNVQRIGLTGRELKEDAEAWGKTSGIAHLALGEAALAALAGMDPATIEAAIRIVEKGSGDHFYGPWRGGAKSEGGRPAGGRDDSFLYPSERKALGLPPLPEKDVPVRAPATSAGPKDAIDESGQVVPAGVGRPDGYGCALGAEERAAHFKADRSNREYWMWEGHAVVGDTAKAESRAREQWVDDSASPGGALLASSVVKAGLGTGEVFSRGALRLEASPEGAALARSMYERTQQALASGPETIRVYRGVQSGEAPHVNALESWTTSRAMAHEFAGDWSNTMVVVPKGTVGRVLVADVRRSSVFMDLRGRDAEQDELVLLGSRIDRSAVRSTPATVKEASGDDHFYGAWRGGAKSEGGHPGGGGSLAEPGGVQFVGPAGARTYATPFDGYGLSPDPKVRLEQAERDRFDANAPKTWEEFCAPPGKPARPDEPQRLADAWADSAMTPKSALLATSVRDAGLGSGMVWTYGDRSLKSSDVGRAAVQRMYERTQADLASGPASMTLYRGYSAGTATRNVLESWTADREVASRFGSVAVMRAEVPRTAIFMDMNRWRRGEESEYVVLGSRLPNSAMTPVEPTLPSWTRVTVGADKR